MSIKTELKAKYQNCKKIQTEEEQRLEIEARRMINKFIIPKFRKISEIYPSLPVLTIKFHSNMGCWRYTSDIDRWEERKQSPYSYPVVSLAVKIAGEFDIEAEKIDDGSGGDTLCFVLNLE